jgi:peptidoglycan lytic transglycosylase
MAGFSLESPFRGLPGLPTTWMMRLLALIVLLAALGTASGCASTRPASASASWSAFVQEGWASYYGSAHQGRRTASGERFDERRLTAAHRSLPFGTMVRVTNLDNGRSVTVTITDRGPFKKHRVIDVSSRAARELGFLRAGTARVRIEADPG